MSERVRPYLFYDTAISICSTCYRRAEGKIIFENGDVTHFRPSGNADEFRMYAVADTAERAAFIVERGIAEPDGIVRRMEKALIG